MVNSAKMAPFPLQRQTGDKTALSKQHYVKGGELNVHADKLVAISPQWAPLRADYTNQRVDGQNCPTTVIL
jgi:hypothetical protein